MRRDEHTGAVVETPPNRFPESAPCLNIESFGGLVQHKQNRIRNKPHGELQPLLLTAGELGRPTFLQAG
jgi:hypothetical protein